MLLLLECDESRYRESKSSSKGFNTADFLSIPTNNNTQEDGPEIVGRPSISVDSPKDSTTQILLQVIIYIYCILITLLAIVELGTSFCI